MLIDTHAHLDFPEYDKDREEVIKRAKREGVDYIINVGCDLESSRKAIELAKRYPPIYVALGIHPHEAKEVRESDLLILKELAKEEKVVAVGETGLDYYRHLSPPSIQEDVFRRQIRLAKELKLPLLIHDRDAHKDILRILKEEAAQEVGGILHCFSGDERMAREAIELGFYISFAGPLTFINAEKPPQMVKSLPIEKMVIETDSPYLAPQPVRGKRNEPSYLRYIAEKMAGLKGLNYEDVCRLTSLNAKRIFNANFS